MKNYCELVKSILKDGENIHNERTGSICRTVVGKSLSYDMSNGDFPLLTMRKMYMKSVVGELLSFFRGYDNSSQFESLGCNIWRKNADENKQWLDNPFRKGEGDLGRIYSKQYVAREIIKLIPANDCSTEQKEYLSNRGYHCLGVVNVNTTGDLYVPLEYELDNPDIPRTDPKSKISLENNTLSYLFYKEENQLVNLVKGILSNPTDRRLIVTGWAPTDKDFQALPACHLLYEFIPFPSSKKLNVVMFLRSSDTMLGLPTNIASTALFLAIIAKMTGYTPNNIVVHIGNSHIYEEHFEDVDTLIQRPIYDPPKLILSDDIPTFTPDRLAEGDIDKKITDAFNAIEPDDFVIEGYQHGDPIKMEMVV